MPVMTLPEKLLDKLVARLVTKGTLTLHHASGAISIHGTPTPGFPDITLRIADKRVARDVLLDPRLGLGEAYMDGRFTVEGGDIMDFLSLVRTNNPWEKSGQLAPPSPLRALTGRVKAAVRAVNKPGTSRRNVAHHYDIGNALYKLMLDAEHMQYSCAYFPREDMTLEEAQEAKLAHIAAKLNLAPGLHVLDIGCGWGGMAIFLAKRAGVTVHGITLSQEQLSLACQRAVSADVADKVSFELIDYRDLAARGVLYDRIVSVGMFEHVGVPQYETFFRACASMLKDDGVMLLHTIGRMGRPGHTDAFTDKWIFPGGYIPALSETVAASEKVRLIAADVETLRLHYARTIRHWYARITANRDAVVGMFDERFYRLWTYYLAGAATSFESGAMCNYQIQYVRNRHALPLTRSWIEQAEAKLLSQA